MIENLANWETRYRQCRRIETGDNPLAGVNDNPPTHEVLVDGPTVETIVEDALDKGSVESPAN